MRWLIMLALFPVLAQAATGAVVCSNGAAGGTLNSCQAQTCVASVGADSLVRTFTRSTLGDSHFWQKLSALTEANYVRLCETAGGPDPGWATKGLLASHTIVVTPGVPSPPSPPATPPAQPTTPSAPVATGGWLWWTPEPLPPMRFKVYRGTKSGTYGTPVEVSEWRYALDGLAPGAYYFAIAPLAADGTEAAKSAEAVVTIAAPASSRTWTCTTPVMKQVGDVTQGSYTCTHQ